ncbi:lactococcin 972 family bacteriocin [Priestia flexa]|uniref:lactococcin 972 family bacteriocin n=1 Tax=Priestia flexa TaxID=86664 RepID=UPI00077C600E|nr:lactococcin 972 family bacteriocin [Priestia flexa]MED4587676.1 lactococcin 972 family bacteriocin [Priestia flexa]
MKKFLAGLAICACLGASAGGASAAELPTNEAGINLDTLIAQEETGSFLIDDTNNKARAAVSAGGGTFEVVWGTDRHYSYYNHDSKEHRSSASNSSSTVRSPWEPKGTLASVWIKSSLWGNKANWATR